MKRLIIIFVLLLTAACSGESEEEFIDFGTDFYQQMFMDGEQSHEVQKMHDRLKTFNEFKDRDLYVSLDKMYESLGDDPASAAAYQVDVMNILNDLED